jgi:hypothetical protein
MAIVSWAVRFVLKLLLQGLFNDTIARTEEEGAQKEEAAKLHAQSSDDAADVSIRIIREQAKIDVAAAQAKAPENDPFNNAAWNGEKQ